MRIISQDGTVDVPYERVVLSVEGRTVQADIGARSFYMGVYESTDDAITVLREIVTYSREKYATYHMPQSNEVKNGRV